MIQDLNIISKENNKKLIVALNRQQFNYEITNSLTTLDKMLFDNYQYKINENLDLLFKIFKRAELEYFKIKDPKVETINDKIKEVTNKLNIITFDFSKFQCEQMNNRCLTVTPTNEKIYWDYGHFSLKGAKYFGKLFLNDNDFLKILTIN